MPNSVAVNTQKTSYNIKSKLDSVLLSGWRSPQILMLSVIYLNMRNRSLERLLCFVLIMFEFMCRTYKRKHCGGKLLQWIYAGVVD